MTGRLPAWVPEFGSKAGALVLGGLTLLAQAPAHASDGQPGRFPTLELKPASHMYVRVGYTHVRPQDRSTQITDASGPVVRHGDEFTPGLLNGTAAGANAAATLQFLSANIRADRPADFEQQGLGTPSGARLDAGSAGSPTVSMGVYLNEARSWAFEAYVAGLPFEVSVRGQGRIGGSQDGSSDLGEVLSVKQLGPIVMLKHLFGSRGDVFRPYLGLGGAYIVFFDAKVSPAVTQYVGGKTSVSLKSAWGPGFFMGGEYRLDERWSLSATLGRLLLKTEGTISTQTDPRMLATSLAPEQAAADIGPMTQTAIRFINGTLTGGSGALDDPSNQLPAVLRELARARTGNPDNLGTYVRKVKATLNPWLFTVALGYDF